MKITKQTYRDAVVNLVPTIDPNHPPYSKRTQHVSYTRKPAGAWVETWVWVPNEYALMHKSRGDKT